MAEEGVVNAVTSQNLESEVPSDNEWEGVIKTGDIDKVKNWITRNPNCLRKRYSFTSTWQLTNDVDIALFQECEIWMVPHSLCLPAQ